MKINVVFKILAAVIILALLLVSVPVVADSGLTSGFVKIKDWDKAHQAFSFSSGQVTSSGGDFFIAPRGIHVFESPGIIDMGLIALDAIGEAPASGYVEMTTPIDGHSYVVRSNGKYGKFYIEETYDWLDPVEYGISWVYQTNGARTFESSSSPAQPTTSGQTGTGAATGCTYEQYIAAYNKLTSLMAQGKGDTPEAQAAYAEYAKVKACYESGSTGTGQTTTPGQTGTGGGYECPQDTAAAYQQYLAAYNKLTYLMNKGEGDTPEAKAAYEQYVKAKACYETGSYGAGTPSTSTTTPTTTTTTTSTISSGQTFNYPPSKWTPYQNGQSTVSIGQDEICVNSMNAGGAWVQANRNYDISTEYTMELDFKIREQDNHYIIIYSDGYLHLDIDWGTALSHHQPGASYSLHQIPGNLQLNRWYRIRMDAHPSQGTFDVYIDGSKVSTATGLTATNASAFHSNPTLAINCTDCIYFGDPDNTNYKGGGYNRGSACWKNISVIGQPKGTSTIITPTPTPTPTPAPTPAPAGTALIAESRTVAPGGTVQVPVNFQNAQNVGSLGFKLAYDPSVVQVVKVSKGSLVAPATFTSNVQPDYIIFGFAMPQSISGTGSAAVVEFQALGAEGSKSPLTLTEIMATGSSGAALSVNSVNGELSIGQKQIGDANGDGKLSVLDALIALKMYVQLLPLDLVADINKDGRVTPEDARLIIEKAKP